MKPKLNHWYVIGWTDAPCQTALCVSAGAEPEFYFPAMRKGAPKVNTVDGNDQILAELKPLDVPHVPGTYDGVICEESPAGRIIKPARKLR